MKAAIMLIDIQNDYFPGGKCELFQPEQAAAQARRVLDAFRCKHLPIYHIQHISTNGRTEFLLPNSHGSEIYGAVCPQGVENVVTKHTPNAFLRTGLEDTLHAQGIDHLVICGMMSHMCIDTTVRAAAALGFSATVLEDACTTRDLIWEQTVIPAQTVHQTIMTSLLGTFAQVLKTEEFLQSDPQIFP